MKARIGKCSITSDRRNDVPRMILYLVSRAQQSDSFYSEYCCSK